MCPFLLDHNALEAKRYRLEVSVPESEIRRIRMGHTARVSRAQRSDLVRLLSLKLAAPGGARVPLSERVQVVETHEMPFIWLTPWWTLGRFASGPCG